MGGNNHLISLENGVRLGQSKDEIPLSQSDDAVRLDQGDNNHVLVNEGDNNHRLDQSDNEVPSALVFFSFKAYKGRDRRRFS
jgi:hypothetical protein